MPLIRRGGIPFPLEHMTQMAPTIRTDNLRPLHAKRAIRMPRHGPGHRVVEGRPTAPGLEFLLSGVQRCGAAGAGVGAGARGVFVVFAGVGRFGALFAEDAELFCQINLILPRQDITVTLVLGIK